MQAALCSRPTLLPLAAAALLLAAASAHAQSIDYGTMEQLFGEAVTTSATGSPQRATEVPADMTIISQDDIRRSGADNLPDILATVPGISIQRNSFGNADVSVRGYDTAISPRLLVLLNGRPVYDDFYGFVPWYNIPVELADIRQIEVVRGPSSALFGFNAAAGAINIVTYDPLYDSTDAAALATGTQGLAEGTAVASAHGARSGLRLSAGGFRANEFGGARDQFPATAHPRRGELSAEWRLRITPDMELTAEAGATDTIYTGAVAENVNRVATNFVRTLLAAQSRAGLVSFAAYRNASCDTYPGLGGESNHVYDLQLSDLAKLSATSVLRADLEYRHNSAASVRFFNGSAGYQDVAPSLMWNWQIMPELALSNAIRLDHLGLMYSGPGLPIAGIDERSVGAVTHDEFSFNSGLVWAISKRDTVRALFGRGLQLPSLSNVAGVVQVAPGIYSPGDPQLALTAVTSAELSYDRALTAIASSLHVSLFSERNENLVAGSSGSAATILPGGGISFASRNIGSSDEVGLEAGLKSAAADGVRWGLSYALAAITDHIQAGLPLAQGTSYAHANARHTVLANLGYSTGRWELDTDARLQSRFHQAYLLTIRSGEPLQIDSFLSLNARIAYALTRHITAAVTGSQLLRDQITETVGIPVERRVIASLSLHL